MTKWCQGLCTDSDLWMPSLKFRSNKSRLKDQANWVLHESIEKFFKNEKERKHIQQILQQLWHF
jgi:hypothetical protein